MEMSHRKRPRRDQRQRGNQVLELVDHGEGSVFVVRRGTGKVAGRKRNSKYAAATQATSVPIEPAGTRSGAGRLRARGAVPTPDVPSRGGAPESTVTARTLDEMIRRHMPAVAIPPPAIVEQARRNVALRVAILEEFGAVTAEQIAELSASQAKNVSNTLNNWQRHNRVAAVEHGGRLYVPGFFLLGNGQPDPVAKEVLRRLDQRGFDGWSKTIWWMGPLASLDDRRPVDILLEFRDHHDEHLHSRLLDAAEPVEDFF